MKSNNKLMHAALKALANGEMTDEDHARFSRDLRTYKKNELTFRELMETIRQPKGELKIALNDYYSDSAYRRIFK
jgi:hypothetical protein